MDIYGRCHLYIVIVLVDWPKIELSPYLGKVMSGLMEISVYGDPDTITLICIADNQIDQHPDPSSRVMVQQRGNPQY